MNGPARRYAGLVTRILAFGVDCAIVNAVAALIAVIVGLALSVLHAGEATVAAAAAIGGVLYLLWSVAYFTVFWSTTGQTPGSRVMGIRVVDVDGEAQISPRRAALRFGAMLLAAVPLCAGFLLILVDDRRRGLHDVLVRTLVLYVPAARRPAASRTAPRDRRDGAAGGHVDVEASLTPRPESRDGSGTSARTRS